MFVCPNCGAHLDSISERCDCENVSVLENELDYIDQRFQEWICS